MTVARLCQLTLIKAVGQELKGHVYRAQTRGVLKISELASSIFLDGIVQFLIVMWMWAPEVTQIAR